MELAELFETILAESPDADAFVDGERRLSFADWWRRSAVAAGGLAPLGIGIGDVVCLLLPSSAEFAVCYLAAMRVGAMLGNMREAWWSPVVSFPGLRRDGGENGLLSARERALPGCIVVNPDFVEDERVTHTIRSSLKKNDVLQVLLPEPINGPGMKLGERNPYLHPAPGR